MTEYSREQLLKMVAEEYFEWHTSNRYPYTYHNIYRWRLREILRKRNMLDTLSALKEVEPLIREDFRRQNVAREIAQRLRK